ncbi:uncharacterized protein LOC124497443 isoform X2 [Dermatophagoides farinae]
MLMMMMFKQRTLIPILYLFTVLIYTTIFAAAAIDDNNNQTTTTITTTSFNVTDDLSNQTTTTITTPSFNVTHNGNETTMITAATTNVTVDTNHTTNITVLPPVISTTILTTTMKIMTTTTEKSDPLIPWIVFIAFIFIPMILIASILLLLLFITLFEDKNRKKRSRSHGSTIVTNLDYPIKLLPSLSDEHRFPEPHESPLSTMIHSEPKPGHYFLDVKTTVKFLQTNQLYHPHSGLLFNLIPNVLYDPLKHCNIRTNINDGTMETPTSSQVYSSFTNEIYERYQFMTFDPEHERFSLTEYDDNIQRLPIELTPDDYVQIYQHLLNKSTSKKKKEKSTSASSSKRKNPLLLDRRDFTKPQTADFHQTPRSFSPAMPTPKSSANNDGKNPNIADDEQSQYESVMFKM